jgi:hypothetical protein
MSKIKVPTNSYWRVHKEELSLIEDITYIQVRTWKMVMEDNNDDFVFITRRFGVPYPLSTVGFMPEGKDKQESIRWLKKMDINTKENLIKLEKEKKNFKN